MAFRIPLTTINLGALNAKAIVLMVVKYITEVVSVQIGITISSSRCALCNKNLLVRKGL